MKKIAIAIGILALATSCSHTKMDANGNPIQATRTYEVQVLNAVGDTVSSFVAKDMWEWDNGTRFDINDSLGYYVSAPMIVKINN